MKIAVDFDGTIVTHEYPAIGEEIPFATETLRRLIADGHQLILWSVREEGALDEAVEWCRQHGVEFWAVNRDYPEEKIENNNHYSRKLKVDMFIDDRNVGGLPDWGQIYRIVNVTIKACHTAIIKRSIGGRFRKLSIILPFSLLTETDRHVLQDETLSVGFDR